MNITNGIPIIITPDENHILSNGTITSNKVYLGTFDNVENWHEEEISEDYDGNDN